MSNQSTTKRVWSRDEFILALDLYHRIEFGRINKTNPDIVKLAKFVGRTPSSIGMRLANFANCDPKLKERGVKGLEGGMKLCQPIWDEFYGKLAYLREEAVKARINILEAGNPEHTTYLAHIGEWEDFVKDINDYPFLKIINKNYNGHCVISGIKIPELLVACHIIPSAKNEEEAMRADNGLLLNLVYAKAYVEGLIGIDKDYKLHISPYLESHKFDSGYSSLFPRMFESKKILVNDAVVKPNPTFLEWHMDTVYNRKAI